MSDWQAHLGDIQWEDFISYNTCENNVHTLAYTLAPMWCVGGESTGCVVRGQEEEKELKKCVFSRRARALSLPVNNVMPVGSALHPQHLRIFRVIINCIKTKDSRSFFLVSCSSSFYLERNYVTSMKIKFKVKVPGYEL